MVSGVGVQFDALLFPHLMLLEYQFNQSLHSSVHPCQFTVIGGWGGGEGEGVQFSTLLWL